MADPNYRQRLEAGFFSPDQSVREAAERQLAKTKKAEERLEAVRNGEVEEAAESDVPASPRV